MTLDDLLANPQYATVVAVLRPYIPVMKRMGIELYNDVLADAIVGNWESVDKKTWAAMTEDERDVASNALLAEARDAVDRAYEREQLAKELAFKLVGSILMSLL